jgi:hypothetical protein
VGALTGSRSFHLQRVDDATSSEALRDALQAGDFNENDHDALCQGPNNEDFVSTNTDQAANDAYHGARQQLNVQPTTTGFADAKEDNRPSKVARNFPHQSANYDDQVRDTLSSYDRQIICSSFHLSSSFSPHPYLTSRMAGTLLFVSDREQ